MWMLKPQIHRNETYSWAALGPIQLIWKRPGQRPLLWLTTNQPRVLAGRQ